MPPRSRIGRTNGVSISLFGSLFVLAALIWTLASDGDNSEDTKELTLYCAAGLKPPVEAAAREYEDLYGVHINIIYGGSGTLLSSMKVADFGGDLYLPADESYCETARSEGFCREIFPLATMTPVIGVAKGNPKGVHSLDDLSDPEIRFGLANPEAAAIGRVVRSALTKTGHWDAVEEAALVRKPTVMNLAADLNIGQLDAAFLWSSTVNQFDGLESVHLQELAEGTASVSVCVLESSKAPTAALRFSRYLSSRDRGAPHFERTGYKPAVGDLWREKPELNLYCGAMLKEALDDTIEEFAEREGLSINRVYDGCGTLVAQMNAGGSPDAYFSCDQSFLDAVSERFHPGTTISSNRMVILVREGNPSRIQGLADLCGPDLKVGLAHPVKSALGKLTADIMKEAGLYERLNASGNLLVQSATGHMLVNQIVAGALDAVVVYRSNAAFALDQTDIIPLPDQRALATQPFAISRGARDAQTLARLLDALVRSDSHARFEALGFGWEQPLPAESK